MADGFDRNISSQTMFYFVETSNATLTQSYTTTVKALNLMVWAASIVCSKAWAVRS